MEVLHLEMQHLRELSHARYGGHFCPFRAKNREISQHIPTEFQIFAFLPQKFGAVTSKCDSSFSFLMKILFQVRDAAEYIGTVLQDKF